MSPKQDYFEVLTYDINPNLSLMNGKIDKTILKKLRKSDPRSIGLSEYAELCRDFIGVDELGWMELNVAIQNMLQSWCRQLFHTHEPLLRKSRFNNRIGSF